MDASPCNGRKLAIPVSDSGTFFDKLRVSFGRFSDEDVLNLSPFSIMQNCLIKHFKVNYL